MRRFFVEDITKEARSAAISGEEFSHLKKVLRLAEGAKVELFNGAGLALAGTIESIGKESAKIKIEGRSEGNMESPTRVVLLQGLLKGEKPELVIQKATELGAAGVVFYSTARTVPVIAAYKTEAKLLRWKKVAVEAAKQCGRTVLPLLGSVTFREAVEGRGGLKIMLWEGRGAGSVKEALKRPEAKDGVAILVGPEGGFSDEEVVEAQKNGFIPVGLGPRILRAETAAIGIVSVVQYELGDMN